MKLDRQMDQPISRKPRRQYAALPWRRGERHEILLVSTRGAQRWIIPKGWPIKGRTPYDAAAQEAFEEAGVIGHVGKQAIGAFQYQKRGPRGEVTCRAVVFPLKVARQLKAWPESRERATRWLSFEEASLLVNDPQLRELILSFGEKLESDAFVTEGAKRRKAVDAEDQREALALQAAAAF